jgi:hypothetical protein
MIVLDLWSPGAVDDHCSSPQNRMNGLRIVTACRRVGALTFGWFLPGRRRWPLVPLVVWALAAIDPLGAADFTVTATSAEFSYTINGTGGSPTLNLVRGRTYTFEVNACSCHPFRINGAPAGSVVNNNIFSGTITFTVPDTAANYTYVCSVHLFGGAINTSAPPLSAIQTWRQTHFGTTANAGDAADTFDFDRDGVPNLVEFAFGLDPKSGGSLQLPQAQLQGDNFVVTFQQAAGVAGVVYAAESSPSGAAGSWTNVPDTGAGAQHTFSIPTLGKARILLRLTVTNTE